MTPWPLAQLPGTGDVQSTAPDLVRFLTALHDGTLLAPAAREVLRSLRVGTGTPRTSGAIRTHGYGPGHFIGRFGTRPAVVNPGDDPGFLALAVHLPEEGLTVVALSNDEADDVGAVVEHALRDAVRTT